MNRNVLRGLALVGAVSLSAAQSAHAALPESVSSAITAAQADGVTLVGLMAAAGAAVFVIKKILTRFGVSL